MDGPYFCLLFSLYLTMVTADYACLCNYEIQHNVLSEPRPGASDIGKLYEFDCKPTYNLVTATAKWQAIQFEHQVGYMPLTDKTKVQTCPGSPNPNDIVTTTTVQTKSFSTKSATNYTTRGASTVKLVSTAVALSTTSPPTSSSAMSTMTSLRYFTSRATTSKTLRYSTSISMKSTSTKSSTAMRQTTGTTRPTPTRRTALRSTTSVSTQSTTTVGTTIKKLHCPPQVLTHGVQDHMEFNGHCYEFNMDPHKNWPDAEHDCNTRGGHLVSIGSRAEQNMIYDALSRRHFYHGDNDIWIGFTDKDVEEHWRWSSGERTTFTFWYPGESHGNFEDCAMLEMDRGGHWGDISCKGFLFSTEKHGYICEYILV